MMKRDKKIDRIRQLMKSRNIAALIVPSADPHQSEYIAEHWRVIEWLTGFSGSAGTVVITHDRAVLWTDFRYYIQAENQISGTVFELYRMGEPGVPGFEKYLAGALKPGDTVGIDGKLLSMNLKKKYETMLEKKAIELNSDIDFIDAVWKDRPQLPDSEAFSFSKAYAGVSRVEKISRIRAEMDDLNASYHLISTLDDIAWTLNLRGSDVHTNPVNIAFVLISPEKVVLFIKREKIIDRLETDLQQSGVEIAEYECIYDALSQIEESSSILVDPENINCRLYHSINKTCRIVEKTNPSIAFKAVKNSVEIDHLRNTAVKDGAAVENFLFWLETESRSGKLTEMSAADKLYEFRKDQDLFIANSFDPIMAYGEHSAMCHYSADSETDAVIGSHGMFLTDSGGNYLTGTTDITRTICRGRPTKQQIEDYTLVLKGHIAVAVALFPEETRGFQLDTLSRQYLWNSGMNFGHGTGHGVGFFLCVHEGPAKLSPHPVDIKLEKGMVLTNEPGVYREDEYGIRLENMILVIKAFENDFGTFMKFENLTYCHFERELIDKSMLLRHEIEWVNTYHAKVYETLYPVLNKEVRLWLKDKTKIL